MLYNFLCQNVEKVYIFNQTTKQYEEIINEEIDILKIDGEKTG